LNRFSYVRENSINRTDPTDHVEILDEDSYGRPCTVRDYQRDLTKEIGDYGVIVRTEGGNDLERVISLLTVRTTINKVAREVKSGLDSIPHATPVDEHTAFKKFFGPTNITIKQAATDRVDNATGCLESSDACFYGIIMEMVTLT
jgi:hypothetical protein